MNSPEYQRQYYHKNKKRLQAQRRKWYEKNKAKINANARAWRKANPKRWKELQNLYLYGVGSATIDATRKVQGDVCAICRRKQTLHRDHNHADGSFRGLLCVRCNTGLGHFKHDVELLKTAIRYLEFPPTKRIEEAPPF